VRYPLHVKGVSVSTYAADFRYRNRRGAHVVEDAEGVRTPLYKLKRNWMGVEHNIEIQEV
jgi:hypothetical protein